MGARPQVVHCVRVAMNWAWYVIVFTALVCSAVAAQQCTDTDYCSGRGTATTDSTGACICRCTLPFNGYRCLFSYQTNTSVDCSNSWYSADQVHCEAALAACYWNSAANQCLPRDSAAGSTADEEAVTVPDCYNAFPLPFIMVVYAIATIAFGFSVVTIAYMGWYYDVFSRVEDSGERVFNQFFNSSAPYIVYSVLVLITSGALAATSWINLNIPEDCTYVVFVYIYLIVQLAPFVIVPLYYIILWIVRKCAKVGDILFELDDHIAPKTKAAMSDPDTNQVRCF
jgi:hypothetical protein